MKPIVEFPPPGPRHWVSNRDFAAMLAWIIGAYALTVILVLVI